MDVTEELAAALAQWSDFPVAAARRPVILTGPTLREAGYVTSDAKIAFGARRLRVADGVPDRAVASLVASIGALEPGTGPSVTVTAAAPVDHEFDTDRGPQPMSAWSLDVTDSIGPIVVLDVDERAQLWNSSLPAGGAGTARKLGSDGTRLRYEFFGSPREYMNYDGAAVAASATAVAICPRAQDLTTEGQAILLYAQQREVDVELTEPLGARVLVNAAGYPVTVLDYR
jgi:hypothetical protein